MKFRTHIEMVGSDLERDPAIVQAAQLLKMGELVALPTETVYGLGGAALNPAAVEKIYAVKNRPADNPLIVHIAHLAQVADFAVSPPPILGRLAEAFWPGPLTLVLHARDSVKDTVCRGKSTVAVRIPNHPVFLAVIRKAAMGIAAPSANLSGKPSPTRADHVFKDLRGKIPLILDGGPCQVGIESTVLDLTGDRPSILRPGAIGPDALETILGQHLDLDRSLDGAHRAPGTRYPHYSPEAFLVLLGEAVGQDDFQNLVGELLEKKGKRVGYLGWRFKLDGRFPDLSSCLMPSHAVAVNLYAAIRQLDEAGLDFLIVDCPPPRGDSAAVMDRLEKAADRYFESPGILHDWLRRVVN